MFNTIYSSGTTGAPKGIDQSHGMRFVHMNRRRIFGYDADAVTVTLPPPAGTGDGVTLNDVIVGPAAGLAGRAVLATAEVAPRTASNEPSPATMSENLTAPTIPIPPDPP